MLTWSTTSVFLCVCVCVCVFVCVCLCVCVYNSVVTLDTYMSPLLVLGIVLMQVAVCPKHESLFATVYHALCMIRFYTATDPRPI